MRTPSVEMRQNFITIFEAMTVYERCLPLVVIPVDAVEDLQEFAPLRTKSWFSSVRQTNDADFIGLAGELAAQKWLELSGEHAWRDFLSGLQGDGGSDVVLFLSLDVKTTTTWPCRYTFTLSNQNRSAADAILFVFLREAQDGALHASLLGWAWAHDAMQFVKPFPDNPRLGRLFIRSLQRAQVLYPVEHLNLLPKREGVI